jgi:hypothetical protein
LALKHLGEMAHPLLQYPRHGRSEERDVES